MGRPRINAEQTPARFAEGTLERIDSALQEGEKRSDFIRSAVENELTRRRTPRKKVLKFGKESALPLSFYRPVDIEVTMIDSTSSGDHSLNDSKRDGTAG